FGGTAASLREATYLPLPEPEPGALGEAAAEAVLEKLGAYDGLLVGCGLGREEATGEFLRHLLGLGGTKRRLGVGFLSQLGREEQPKHRPGVGFRSGREAKPEPAAEKPAEEQHDPGSLPLVIDADGLNLLAGVEDWAVKLRERPTVLTPHPGEMARLLGVERIGEDAAEVAASAAAEWGVVVVLKGAHTVVAAPDGQVALHGAANAALATAGTGDVLAGLIVGLLAQGLAPFDAARLGVGVHGLAGRLLSDELGDRGVVAGDLLPRLPLAFRRLVG
ncbi:MAG TPA: NAD(P)H-hydrate dehydratase, partial [Herpetosiphonaceae bacterium]